MFFFFGAQEMLAAGTTERVLVPGAFDPAIQSSKTTNYYVTPSDGTLRNFFLRSRTTGAGAGTITARVWVNAAPSFSGFVDTGINITVSQNSNLESENTSDEFPVGAGDQIAITLQNSVAGTTGWEEPSATIELVLD